MRRSLVVLIALFLPFSATTVLAGGVITSGTTVSGSVAGPTYLESWTFSGVSGQRILVNAVTTSGLLNTQIVLKQPGGAIVGDSGGADQLDVQLAATGTFTLEIRDIGLNDAGTYEVNFTNLTGGPLSGGGDTDGGAIASADVMTGTISGVADMDCFTFSGISGQRVLIDAIATGGTGFDTYMILYPPNGGSYAAYATADFIDFQLNASGTWTVAVMDYGADVAGSYSISLLNLQAGPLTSVADTDGGPIDSDQILTGQMQASADMDAFTFFAFGGSRVLITGVATGGTLNTNLLLYAPGGAAAVTTSGGQDYLDVQTPVTGVYTLVVTDVGLDAPGSYTISMNNVTAGPYTSGGDSNGGLVASGTVKSGTISGIGDQDVYTFTGTFGDRVILDLAETAGVGFNAQMVVYSPNGGSYATYTSSNRLDWQLNASGIWAVVFQDVGFDTPGSYSFSLLNVTSGPLTTDTDKDGGAFSSNAVKNASFQQGQDMDAYTFTGVAGHRVLLTAVATGGGSHNTDLYLYPPGGGPAESASSGDYLSVQLAANGTYTFVVGDLGSDNPGTYTVSRVDLTSGPYSDVADPDGGAIASATVKSGSITGVGDLDAYTFTGNSGDRVLIDGMETSGVGFSMTIVLYPPTGGDYYTYATASRLDTQLNASGTWTILIEDNGFDTAGSYDLSMLNVTAGPLTGGSDTDGGAVVSDDIRNGQLQQGVDFDAYTFTGVAGHRMYFTAVATGGGTHNTNMTLYPPDGGAYEGTTSGDYLDTALLASGTYTLVIEDYGNDNPGAYTMSLVDLTSGPYTSGSDVDGGAIASSTVKTGTTSGVGDLDVYTFTGNAGQHVLIDFAKTAGASYQPYITLYPPNGGSYVTYATSGRLDYQLAATGTFSVLVYDSGFDGDGSYELSLLNLQGGPLTNGTDTDGGAITSNIIKTGSFQQVTDMDAYTFNGVAGQRVVIAAVATGGGGQNTELSLYPPNGGGAEAITSGDRVDVQLARTGTYTMVVEEYSKAATGGYTVSFVNLGNGPFVGGGDTDGGPVASNQIVAGTISGVADLDAYQFNATYGDRILAVAVATAGVNFNTTMYLYPPGGGAAIIGTSGDQIDVQLNTSGTWTLLVEDSGDDTPGSYSFSLLNLSAGPYSGNGETDGGPLTDNVTVPASMIGVADTDGYTFYGLAGRTCNITALTTSGLMDTHIVLYPPGGAGAVLNTTSDTAAPVLTQDGYYTLVVQDYANDNTGNYTVKVHQTGAAVTGVGDAPPAELALHPAVPSPFSQSTRVDYDLPGPDRVSIGVYDVTGARIRTLADGARSAGRFAATWDGRDDAGRRVASGVYYLRMQTRSGVKNQKVVLVR